MHPSSFPPQPPLIVFQTKTCSWVFWLCQVRSKSYQCALRILQDRFFTWLLTSFFKALSLLSPGFPVTTIPHFLEKQKPQKSWRGAEHGKQHVPTCSSCVPPGPKAFCSAQSMAGHQMGRGSPARRTLTTNNFRQLGLTLP